MQRPAAVTIVGILVLLLGVAVQAATVERFSPLGEVRAVRRVAVRFSEDVVRFGDPKAPAPFAIECAEAGQGRWLDARNWVFDFGRDLGPGLRCAFRLKPELRALAGSAVSGRTEFGFSTGGPAVLSTQPYQGAANIDEEQTFILRLNGAALEASVLAHAWCVAEGVGERIPVALVGGATRAEFFKALKREREAADDKLVLLQCRQRLPAGANISLIWGRGIASNLADVGQRVSTTQDQQLKFKVRPEFKLAFNCARDNAQAPCSPYQPMSIEFSATVARALADGIRINSAAGQRKPAWTQNDPDAAVTRVTFNPPFAENADLTVTLPAKFADDSGRAPVNAASFPLKTRSGEGSPLVKFAAGFGIIERSQPILPVTLRNVEPALRQSSLNIKAGADALAATSVPAPKGVALNRVLVSDDAQIIG